MNRSTYRTADIVSLARRFAPRATIINPLDRHQSSSPSARPARLSNRARRRASRERDARRATSRARLAASPRARAPALVPSACPLDSDRTTSSTQPSRVVASDSAWRRRKDRAKCALVEGARWTRSEARSRRQVTRVARFK